MPAVVVLVAALAAGALVALVTARFPAVDPAAPRARAGRITEDVEAHPRATSFLRSRFDPEATTGLLLTAAIALAIGAAIGIGTLFEMVQHHAGLAHWDLSAARWGADHATPTSTHILRDVSLLGGTVGMIVVALLASLVEWRRTRRAIVFVFMTIVVAGQSLVMNVTKYVVDRPRPNIARLTGFSSSSFPSGHATAAAATFAAAAFLLGRGRSSRVKAICAGAAAGVAVGVATTRVLLGVHWFTDVLAGLALGWGWFAVTSIAFGGRILSFGEPIVIAQRAADRGDAAAARTGSP